MLTLLRKVNFFNIFMGIIIPIATYDLSLRLGLLINNIQQ